MRNVLIWAARVVVVLLILAFLIIGVYPRIFETVKKTKNENSADWMKDLKGSLYLSEISMPGAHDAATANVQLPLITKCQDLKTKDLLEEGYRYLDVRLGLKKTKSGSKLELYHSFAHCLKGSMPFAGHMTLDVMLDDCYEFLEEHPTECIVFVVKQEYGNDSKADFELALQQYVDQKHWLLTDHMPTLNEARGKIVLFRRYQDMAELGKESGIYMNWTQQKDNSDTRQTIEKGKCDALYVHVQDRYKYSVEDKWKAFHSTISRTPDLVGKDSVVINFLSTSGTGTFGIPYSYAKDLNQQLLNEDISGPVGWVIVDFGNGEIAEHIYECNFTSGK